MQLNAGKLQLLTAAAILVLISGGIAAYAENQSALAANGSSGPSPVALATADTNSTTTSTSATSSVTVTATSTSNTVQSTTTTTSTTSTTANQVLCQPTTTPTVGRLVLPITAVGATTGSSGGSMTFSDNNGCVARITAVGGIFDVSVSLRYAKPVTQYSVVLVANGTSYTVGSMVTGQNGAGQLDNQVLLSVGTYTVSIQIFDVSSNPGHSTLVLQTGVGTIVSPPFPTATSGQQPFQTGHGQSNPHR